MHNLLLHPTPRYHLNKFRLACKDASSSPPHRYPPLHLPPPSRYQLEKFQRACKDASSPLPPSSAIAAKVEELKRYKEHVYTEEEISQIVQLKKQARGSGKKIHRARAGTPQTPFLPSSLLNS